MNEGSARPTPPGAIWYAVAAAILLTGWGPIFMFLVLPVGSPEGVHLGARFRPDTTITVSLRAGDRLAIRSRHDRDLSPEVSQAYGDSRGAPDLTGHPVTRLMIGISREATLRWPATVGWTVSV